MDLSDYQKAWDQQYFKDYFLKKDGHLWDVEAQQSAEIDFSVMSQYLDAKLPLIDIGCGVGHQSAFFSTKYPSVVGVDVSKRAVQLANSNYDVENLSFEVVDFTQRGSGLAFYERHGSCNVYMRGVLHQIKSEDEEGFASEIATVLGSHGHMYFNEVSDSIRDYLGAGNKQFNRLPEKMRQVFVTHMPPSGVSEERIRRFAGSIFEIHYLNETFLATRLNFSDGEAIKIPSWSCVLRRKS